MAWGRLFAQQFENTFSDQHGTARVERDFAAIEIERRLLSGRQGEVAELEGLFADQGN